MNVKPLIRNLFVLLVLCLTGFAADVYAAVAAKEQDSWRKRENLALRFGAELHKVGVLTRELDMVSDMLADLRNIELYPGDVTRMDENAIVAFDRKIETIEKQEKTLRTQVMELHQPITDAMGILRELVVGQPVEDMFVVLENGDMQRINTMLDIKHRCDNLWQKVDTLLSSTSARMGFTTVIRSDSLGGIEQEFFDIIQANLGQQWRRSYDRLQAVKDSLLLRASPQQMRAMYAVDKKRISQIIATGKYSLAEQKAITIRQQYEFRIGLEELNLMLIRARFLQGNYEQTIAGCALLPDTGAFFMQRELYRLQSLYALGDYAAVWQSNSTLNYKRFGGAARNQLIWMVLQSGIELDSLSDGLRLAGQVDKNAPYALYVMHALGVWYVERHDFTSAIVTFEGALKFKAVTAADVQARNKIVLATAQAYYEQKQYEKALSIFFTILDREDGYEQALYGMVWCYISMGLHQKADLTMRKLINQSVESPLAANALLIMSRRFINKAQYEWKKITWLSREESQLSQAIERLSDRRAADTARSRARDYDAAVKKLTDMRTRIQGESRENSAAITAYYNNAAFICSFVNKSYKTGSFQDVSFSDKREQLLHLLDSLIAAAGTAGNSGPVNAMSLSGSMRTIKSIVQQQAVLSVEIDLDRYRWEREYRDWQKTALRESEKELTSRIRTTGDSLMRLQLSMSRNRLLKSIDSLVRSGDTLQMVWQERLTERCSTLLMLPLYPRDAAYIRYHLGELYYAGENEQYMSAYHRYELAAARADSLMKLFNDGRINSRPENPVMPRLDHARSMQQYRAVLLGGGDSTVVPAAHYSLAWCFTDIAQFDSANSHMQIVCETFRQSQYAPQAFMYRGESAFDHGRLADAIKSYQAVMLYPESEWFDEALYKLAWAQYRLSNPQKAISSFLALIDLGGTGASAIGSTLLEKESMDYIAISFSEIDPVGGGGLERAVRFVEKLNDPQKATLILHRLASIYKDLTRYDMAAKTYRTLLSMYPNYQQNPRVELELITVLERNLPQDQSCRNKVQYFRKYGAGSGWWNSQADQLTRNLGDSLAQEALYDAGLSYNQLAIQKNDPAIYRIASQTYEAFIRSYPQSARANECHYNMAEILFSLGNYFKAAEEYMAVSKRYPGSKYRETAAWNAIVASQEFLKQEKKGAR